MRDIKFRLLLRALVDTKSGYKKGETLTLFNDIFSRSNGVAFFELGLEWEILSADQYTGLNDKKGVEIYENDILTFEEFPSEKVIFQSGSFGYVSTISRIFIPLSESNLTIVEVEKQ